MNRIPLKNENVEEFNTILTGFFQISYIWQTQTFQTMKQQANLREIRPTHEQQVIRIAKKMNEPQTEIQQICVEECWHQVTQLHGEMLHWKQQRCV